MSAAGQFANRKYITLETCRTDGTPVQTVVWVVDEGGTIYVRTSSNTGKVKRIRRNPHVRIAPSDFRGRAAGEWVEGEARLVDGADAGRVLGLFNKKYGISGRLIEFINGLRGMHATTVVAISL